MAGAVWLVAGAGLVLWGLDWLLQVVERRARRRKLRRRGRERLTWR